jgi:hypothetical protein
MKNAEKKTDRYQSFIGIDCEGNSKRLMAMLRRHIDDPAKSNPFWEKFKEKLAEAERPIAGRRHLDELFLIHSYINNIEDIFEQYEDQEALDLLKQVEEECC